MDGKCSQTSDRIKFEMYSVLYFIILYRCCTSHLLGLLRLHFYHRPRRAKSWVSPRLTGAMVPPKFHPRFFFMPGLHFGSSHVGRGLGSVRSFSGTKTSLTIWLELHCPGEGFFWPSLSLNWTSTRNEDSNDFDGLRLQKLACVSFVSSVGRRPDLKQGNYLHTSQFGRSNPLWTSWTVVSFIEWRPALLHGSCLHPSQFRPTDYFVWRDFGFLWWQQQQRRADAKGVAAIGLGRNEGERPLIRGLRFYLTKAEKKAYFCYISNISNALSRPYTNYVITIDRHLSKTSLNH